MDSSLNPLDRELVINRDIRAPREAVFAAWTDSGRAAAWWCPSDCSLVSCEMDVKPGGRWLRRMRVPGGDVVTKFGVYLEVTPPSRLVFTYATRYGNGTSDPETVVSLTLADLGGGRTRLTLWHTGFEATEVRDSHIGGWTTTLERLAEAVDRTAP